jgi:hypothetical protein
MDPSSWQQYFEALDQSLVGRAPKRLTGDQVETAWNYAYRFFFEYPFDFPWRLIHFWSDLDVWPIRRVLSNEGRGAFESTFRHLAGEPVSWKGRFTNVKAAAGRDW